MTIEAIMTILGSNAVVAIISYFTGRRQLNATTDNQVLHNLEISINVYRGIIEDLKNQIQTLNVKVQELEDKVDELMEENHNLKKQHRI